ncbi:MAG: imelysin [Gammaproteobacteria bacterium]|nr:imelysin [Gammaproteobacteria bacterium]
MFIAIGFISVFVLWGKASAANKSILDTYVDLALDSYTQALHDAENLQRQIDIFAEKPDLELLQNAKKAWLVSRDSYGQTEIFRLANGPIDAEEGWIKNAYGALEGQINAWPLDENMIDYTIDADGKKTSGNIIDTLGYFTPGGEDPEKVNVITIGVDSITQLNENGGDANVATGYHAIEFLLWGQDQDYNNFAEDTITNGAMVAGKRPLTDFTNDEFAARRLAYLKAASLKLVNDLEVVTRAWHKELSGDCEKDGTGCYRAAILGKLSGKHAEKNIDTKTSMRQIITGMGVFIKSELANERIAVAVLTPSEEDEHSCFSDNTHRDIATNYQGFINVLKGTFNNKQYGTSFYSLSSEETQNKMNKLIESIDSKVANINELAETKWHFDYQILPGNNAKEIKSLKNDMRRLGDAMVDVAKDMDISLTEDDVTDADETKV